MVLMPRMAAVLLLACLGAPAVAHTPANRDVAGPALQPPAAVVGAFHLALRQDRKADALALLADDALIFESGGIEAGKSAYAAEHLGADVEFAAATKTLAERRWGGVQDNIAAWVPRAARAALSGAGPSTSARPRRSCCAAMAAYGASSISNGRHARRPNPDPVRQTRRPSYELRP